MWRNGGGRRRRSVGAGPRVSDQIGILRAQLQSSFGTGIHFEPEPECALDRILGLTTAGTHRSETVTGTGRGQSLGVATIIFEGWRSVAHLIAGTGVNLIAVSHILLAAIEIYVNSWGVIFQREQALIAAQRFEPPKGVYRSVW